MMETYHRVNELEKSKVLFVLRKFFESKEEVVFSYLYGDFLYAHFFKQLNVGIYFDDKKIREEKWRSEVETYNLKLKEDFFYPVDFLIINNAPVELQIDAVRGSLLSCSSDELRERFLKTILKD